MNNNQPLGRPIGSINGSRKSHAYPVGKYTHEYNGRFYRQPTVPQTDNENSGESDSDSDIDVPSRFDDYSGTVGTEDRMNDSDEDDFDANAGGFEMSDDDDDMVDGINSNEVITTNAEFEECLVNAQDRNRWETSDKVYQEAQQNKVNIGRSVIQGVVAVLVFIMRVKLQRQYWPCLLNLICLFIHPALQEEWPKSTHQFQKITNTYQVPTAKRIRVNEDQNKRNSYFTVFNMKDSLQLLYDSAEFCGYLLQGIRESIVRREKYPDYLFDVCDGRIHDQLRSSYLLYWFHLTGILFLDGVSMFKSGLESFYPAFVCLCQLAQKVRWLPRFTILAGLLSSKCGDNLQKYIQELVDIFNESNDGVEINIGSKTFRCRLRIVLVVLDMKEKGKLLMMKSCGGWFACHLCYLKGILVGKKVYYPPANATNRTQLSWMIDQELAKTHVGKDIGLRKCSAFRGRKSGTLFDDLNGIQFPRSFPVDNMHVDTGVVLTLIKMWKKQGILTKSAISSINGLVKKTMVPFNFTRPMRSFDAYEKFKCDEWKNLTLYTAGAYFEFIVPNDKFSNFMFYARGIKISKMQCMHKGVTYQIDICFELFYTGLDVYQDDSIYTLKVHTSGSHSGASFRDCGLLDEASAKLFEHLNGVLVHGSHGTHDIDDQLVENFNYLRYANQMAQTLQENELEPKDTEYYQQLLKIGLRNNDEIDRLSKNWKADPQPFDPEFAYCRSSAYNFDHDLELVDMLRHLGESAPDGIFVDKLTVFEIEFRVKSTDTENRSNSHILYKHANRKALGRIHALYRTCHKQWKVLIHYYDEFDDTQIYPRARLPLLDHYQIKPITDLIDICVVVPTDRYIFMTPVKSDYLFLKPIADWRQRYKNVEHEHQGLVTPTAVEQMLRNAERDSSNYTYPKCS